MNNILKSTIAFIKKHLLSISIGLCAIIIAIIVLFTLNPMGNSETSKDETATNESTDIEQNETEDPVEETPEVVEPETEEKEEGKETEKEEKEPVKEEKTEEKKEDKKETSSSSNKKTSGNKSTSSNKNNSSNSNKTESTNSNSSKEDKKEDSKDTTNTDTAPKKEKTVVRTEEGVRNGLKYIWTYYSDGTVTSVDECQYCHQMPCSNGGGENCPQYNVKEDAAETCQQCGRPCGDGYNGTCYGQIDWSNGGKVTCNHYD